MKDETRNILDSILADWHRWQQGFQAVASHGTSAMFTGVKSSRQWDSESEALDGDLHNSQMKAVDFHVGELCPMYRTALSINARNIVTGKSVWTSVRLPTDVSERAAILGEARSSLCCKLRDAGVM